MAQRLRELVAAEEHSRSQLSIAPVLGDGIGSCEFCRHQACMWYTDKHVEERPLERSKN